jgi:RNA polymerase sigma factor (sigma-70 family)
VTSETTRRRFTELVLPHLDDAYLRALKALDNSAPVERPRAWMLAIVRNTAYTWLAKNRPSVIVLAGDAEEAQAHVSASETSGSPSPEAALIEAADHARVVAAIEKLSLPFKEVLVMREVNGLSYREISEATGVPIGTCCWRSKSACKRRVVWRVRSLALKFGKSNVICRRTRLPIVAGG